MQLIIVHKYLNNYCKYFKPKKTSDKNSLSKYIIKFLPFFYSNKRSTIEKIRWPGNNAKAFRENCGVN